MLIKEGEFVAKKAVIEVDKDNKKEVKKEVKKDGKKEVKKDNKKDSKKVGLIKTITGFFKSVWFELKKVTWPTKPELRQHTSVVLGIVLIMTVLVWAIDSGLGGILSLIIRR